MDLSEIDRLTTNAQMVKDITLKRLLDDGVISVSDYETYTERYQVVIVNQNWFTKWVKKFGDKKNEKSKSCFIFKMLKFEL